MRLQAACLAAGAALVTAGAADAASVEIKDAVARVTVIPEARSDVRVEVLSTNPDLPLQVRSGRDGVVVDGDLERRIRSCSTRGGRPSVRVAGIGEVAHDAMPHIVVRTPRDVEVSAGGAVFGAVGRAASVELSNAGCGDWTVANVEGRLRANLAGSGDMRTGAAGEAVLRVAGSGDIRTQAILGRLQADVAGSGDIAVASVDGPLEARVAGSGDVRILGGHARPMTASVLGSGDVVFDGTAEALSARIAGSGDVRARQVTGQVQKTVMGSGGVIVGE